MNTINIKSVENDGLPETQIKDLEEMLHDILKVTTSALSALRLKPATPHSTLIMGHITQQSFELIKAQCSSGSAEF